MHPLGTLVRFIWRSTKRAVVMCVGMGLLVAGVVMLVTPGPGIVLLVAGLAVLATEFVWAERMLDKAKTHAATATDKVPGSARVKVAARRLWRREPRSDRPTAAGAAAPDPAPADEAADRRR
jgi:uncharacterized protein (TIGR02611 family)